MMNDPAQACQIGDDRKCTSCHETPLDAEYTQCRICEKYFHVVCNAMPADEKWGTKTMFQLFKQNSTKRNLLFLCNVCLTTFEQNAADIHGQRIRKMEQNMEHINQELQEMKRLITSSVKEQPKPVNEKPIPAKRPTADKFWSDVVKLGTSKAKPAESRLVINKSENPTVNRSITAAVEKTVLDNKIQVTKSFNDKDGNLVVLCGDTVTRDLLKTKVNEAQPEIEMKTPNENRPAVSIVGLSKSYEHQEVIDLLKQQNHFLSQFAEANKLEDHIKVFAVKPTRSNQNIYQAFARISSVLRQGFKTFNDKVLIGLSTCKVYDQHHVKRCNNCQCFGHFYKECPTPDVPVCANCGANHRTPECEAFVDRCANCVKAGLPPNECEHKASDPGCPTLRKTQDKFRNNLNMRK